MSPPGWITPPGSWLGRAPERAPGPELACQVSVNIVPVESRGPGIASTSEPFSISMAVSVYDEMDWLVPLTVARAFVKVTFPKSASEESPQLGAQIPGRSAIHSAEDR